MDNQLRNLNPLGYPDTSNQERVALTPGSHTSAGHYIPESPAAVEGGTPKNSWGGKMSWLDGAQNSFLWGLGPGLIGVKPTGELHKWQAQNPKSAFGAEMLGLAVPYAGAAKLATMSSKYNKMVEGASKIAGGAAASPFVSGAAREVARFAPIEGAFLAANYYGGDTVAEWTGGHNAGVANQAFVGGVSLAAGGVLGGAFGKLASMVGNKVSTRGITPEADLGAPFQGQYRQVKEAMEAGRIKPEFMEQATAGLNSLKESIIRETPAKDGRYVTGKDTDQFNNLFAPKDSRIASSRLDTMREPKTAEWIKENMPEDWEAYAQFPRRVRAKEGSGEAGAKAFSESMKALRQGDASTRWEFLQGEEKFLISKRMNDDSWLVFKTDKPEVFLPKEARFSDLINRYNAKAFGGETTKVTGDSGSTILDYGAKLDMEAPHLDTRGLSSKSDSGTIGKGFEKLASKLENASFKLGDSRYEVGAAMEGLGEIKRSTGAFIKKTLASTPFQFVESPMAMRIHKITQEMLDRAQSLGQRAIMGDPVRADGRVQHFRDNVLGARFEGNGSIAARLKKLEATNPEGFNAVIRAIQSEGGIAQGLQDGLTKEGVQIMHMIKAVDDDITSNIIAAQRAAGVPEDKIFRPKDNHFMLSRVWDGQYRTPVYSGDKLVYVAGGKTGRSSADLARKVAEGQGWRVGDTAHTRAADDIEYLRRMADNDADYLRAMQRQREVKGEAKPTTPGTFQKREGVEGYKSAYTADELTASLVGHSTRYRRYEAEMAHSALFNNELGRLQKSDPTMYARLMERRDAMFGVRGEVDKSINKFLDSTPMGKLLGGDSASQIVQALSKYTYVAALGFYKMGYNVATLATFMQTSIPMMKYVNTLAMQAPERLGRYVTYRPVMSADGHNASVIGTLDAMKVAHGAMKEMGNPGKLLQEHLWRGAAEGKTDPGFLSEYVGQGSTGWKRFQSIWKGENPISDTLVAVGTALPSMSERWARAHSFTMGHIFYRDVMGVTDPNTLYRLAAEFTDLTQFQYGRAHKPMIFDGPQGQMAGMFKTFLANYTGWMSVYAGEGIKHNNWAPLAWQMAGTASMAGVAGLPLYGAADGIWKSFDENDRGIAESLRAAAGSDNQWAATASDMLMQGLPGVLGASIQGTMQAPFTNPVEDSLRLLSSAQLDQGIKMGKAIGLTAQSLFDPNINATGDVSRALLNGFAPKSIITTVQAMQDKDLRSMNTGQILMKDLTYAERVLWGLGLNPTEVNTAFTVFRSEMDTMEGKKKALEGYSKRMSDAIGNRDTAEISRVVTEASVNGIPASSLVPSVKKRLGDSHNDMFQQHFDRRAQYRMHQLGLIR